VDYVAWWADGKKKEAAEALGKAVEAALEWAGRNGATFDHAKTEAMFLSEWRRNSTESVRIGEHDVPSNQHAGGSESGSTPR